MRIISEFDKDGIKITVFQMNGRISVKFEDSLLEQTYKFRDGSGIDSLDDVMKFIDDDFVQTVRNIFHQMNNERYKALEKKWKNAGDTFPEII